MSVYHGSCANCGKPFKAIRAVSQGEPRFCSKSCYKAAPRPSKRERSVVCAHCGKTFAARRSPNQPPAKYCTWLCYNAEPRPTRDRLIKETVGRRRQVGRKVDGEFRHMNRARWVWNQNHPDDPAGSGDHVHHIDENRLNDDPANLVKVSPEEHKALHKTLPVDRVQQMSQVMKAYHRANPGKQRKGQPRICPVCGTEFYRPPSAKGTTCSYACMGKLQSQTGSVRGDRNGNAKLSNEQRDEIRHRRALGERQIDLAREFGVSRDQIARICRPTT